MTLLVLAAVRLVTRWPMVGIDTVLDVYLDWILPKLYRAGVEMVTEPHTEPFGRTFAFKDADGRVLHAMTNP